MSRQLTFSRGDLSDALQSCAMLHFYGQPTKVDLHTHFFWLKYTLCPNHCDNAGQWAIIVGHLVLAAVMG